MEGMKHTPGPWEADEYRGVHFIVPKQEGGNRSIAKMLWKDQGANARLIAAAPEMLELIEELANREHSMGCRGVIPGRHCNCGKDEAQRLLERLKGKI